MPTKRSTSSTTRTEMTGSSRAFSSVYFEGITEAGAYYNHDTGSLYRIPEEVLALGHSPMLNIVSNNENLVTKISDDPWVPLNKARQICSNMDFAVNF